MNTNPKQRNMMFIGIGGAILIIGTGFIIASKNTSKNIQSGASIEQVPTGIKALPGASNNPDYVESVKKVNEEEAKKASQEGKTFIPTITADDQAGKSSLDDIMLKQKLEAEEKAKKELELKNEFQNNEQSSIHVETQTQPVVIAPSPLVEQKVQTPKKYNDDDYLLIKSLTSSWRTKQSITEHDFSKDTIDKTDSNSSENTTVAQNQAQTSQIESVVLAKSGNIYNAIIETGVNSDEESPVLAKIVSGPLKGTRLIGTIKNLGEKVAIVFTTANIPSEDRSIKLNAFAVDAEKGRTALAEDVDHHYLLKYGVLLASSFVSGYAQAIMSSGATQTQSIVGTTTTNPTFDTAQINKIAIGKVGTEFANKARTEFANIKPTITISAGTAIGVLFMEDLVLNKK